MRKIIAVILTLCVLLGGTALAELSDDFTGTWYLDTPTAPAWRPPPSPTTSPRKRRPDGL